MRCFARSLIAWGPLVALALLGGATNVRISPARPGGGTAVAATSAPPVPARKPKLPGGVEVALMLLAAGGAAFAVWRPTRGIAERAAGVVLVPK